MFNSTRNNIYFKNLFCIWNNDDNILCISLILSHPPPIIEVVPYIGRRQDSREGCWRSWIHSRSEKRGLQNTECHEKGKKEPLICFSNFLLSFPKRFHSLRQLPLHNKKNTCFWRSISAEPATYQYKLA